MYTQCPQCLTVYRIQADALTRGRGRFRCGHCGWVFDGLDALVERIPDEPFQHLPCATASDTPVVLSIPAMRPVPVQPALFDHAPDAHLDGRREPRLPGEWILDARDAMGHSPPSDIGSTRPRARVAGAAQRAAATQTGAGNGRWWFGSLVLALTLGGQVALAEREQLLEDPHVRPWLDRACQQLGCHLPLQQAPGRIRLISREVRPHPEAPKALLISAGMINDAAFTQSFPIVEVVLSDLSERPIAMRRFLPSEYLGEAESELRGFASGSTAPLVFEVADPGQEAVAFEFRFLPATPR